MIRPLYFCLLVFTGVVLLGGQSYAHHPTEGSVTLDQLIKEAEAQNLDIKEAENNLKASEKEARSKNGQFYPHLSIEGGPQSTKFDEEKDSGNSLYGKAEWNLYRGGKDSNEVDKAQIKSELDQKKYESIKSKISREVSRVYYEMMFLLEGYDLKEKAITLNQEQMKLAKVKRSSGFTSNADVIEFELRDATLKSDLKMFSQLIAEKSNELSVLLGRKDSSVPNYVHGHLTRESSEWLKKENFLSRINSRNLDIAEAQSELKMSEKDSSSAKSGYMPSIDLEAKYGKLATEEKVFDDKDNYSVALKLTIPLFSGLETKYQTGSAKSSVAAKNAFLSRKSLSIYSEAENLFTQISTLTDRLNLEEKNLTRSEEYYKVTLSEYKRGVKNSPDMVGASERLLDARLRNLEFRKDYYLTKLKIYELVSSDPLSEK